MFRALMTVNFTIFQKVIASRVYIFSDCERVLFKELFFLFVILKALFSPPEKQVSFLNKKISRMPAKSSGARGGGGVIIIHEKVNFKWPLLYECSMFLLSLQAFFHHQI